MSGYFTTRVPVLEYSSAMFAGTVVHVFRPSRARFSRVSRLARRGDILSWGGGGTVSLAFFYNNTGKALIVIVSAITRSRFNNYCQEDPFTFPIVLVGLPYFTPYLGVLCSEAKARKSWYSYIVGIYCRVLVLGCWLYAYRYHASRLAGDGAWEVCPRAAVPAIEEFFFCAR
ncbi:hypothetical protein HOY80DRAFT_248155 [Tuber brumale]|nr:hypothetical protein HOY80DRAFT_248155 [Tuber brumale]